MVPRLESLEVLFELADLSLVALHTRLEIFDDPVEKHDG